MKTYNLYQIESKEFLCKAFIDKNALQSWLEENCKWIQTETARPSPLYDYIDGQWKVNEREEYIAIFNQVDNARRSAYSKIVTPLMEEANIKRKLINTAKSNAEADDLEKQALAARMKIQAEHPWPTAPTN